MVKKIYPWLKFEIIGVFVNTFTADYNYSVPNVRICRSLFKCNYLKNACVLLSFLFHLWNLNDILNIFKKKKIIIANVFPKLQTVKCLGRPLHKKRRFRTSVDSQHVKRYQTLSKSVWKYFYHIFSSLWGKKIWKISPLYKFEILGVFVNTFTADYMYPFPDCENLLFPIEMQLS